MRNFYTLALLGQAVLAHGQLVNGSFESNGNFSLDGWQWTCEDPAGVHEAPIGEGDWSVSKQPSEAKGCFANYLYQRIPEQLWIMPLAVSGWVRCDSLEGCHGAYIGFGHVNNGHFTIEADTGTQALAWQFAEMLHTPDLGPGDTAIVVLHAGFSGGPSFFSPGHFDGIVLSIAEGLVERSMDNAPVVHYDPSSAALDVALPRGELEGLDLFDPAGRRLATPTQRTGANTLRVDLIGYPTGLYLVRTRSSSGAGIVRFVKP